MTEFVRLTHGVHRPAHLMRADANRMAALLCACPPGTVVAELTAARLHGLWLPSAPPDPNIDVVLHGPGASPRSRAGTRRREIRGRRRSLRKDETELCEGIPVTTAARTWIDLGERLSLPDLVAAGDCALRGSTTLDEIDTLLGRAVHRRGVVRVRQARELLDGRSRSRPESRLRVALVTAGLPVPEVNKPMYNAAGEWLFEPDLAYEDVRLALEYNGADHAELGRSRRDITRTLDVYERGGWHVVTFGPAEVFGRPDQVAATVARLRLDRFGRFGRCRPGS